MPDQSADLQPGPETRRSKFEIRTVLLIVAALIVIGGLFGLIFGSPTRNRAAVDNVNTNPYPAIGANVTGSARNPPSR